MTNSSASMMKKSVQQEKTTFYYHWQMFCALEKCSQPLVKNIVPY